MQTVVVAGELHESRRQGHGTSDGLSTIIARFCYSYVVEPTIVKIMLIYFRDDVVFNACVFTGFPFRARTKGERTDALYNIRFAKGS